MGEGNNRGDPPQTDPGAGPSRVLGTTSDTAPAGRLAMGERLDESWPPAAADRQRMRSPDPQDLRAADDWWNHLPSYRGAQPSKARTPRHAVLSLS